MLLVIGIGQAAKGQDETLIRSWQTFEEQLEREIQRSETKADNLEAAYLATEAFARLRISKQPSLWREMVQQGENPLVANLGFLCIREHDSGAATEAAMNALVFKHDKTTLAVYDPVVRHLRELKYSQPAAQTFSAVLSAHASQRLQQFSIMTAFLRREFLAEWIEAVEPSKIPATGLALVLDDVLAKEPPPRSSEKLSGILAMFKSAPGYPRLVYLIHTSAADKETELMIRTVLEDESLTLELYPLVLARRDAIKKALESGAARLSPKGREQIERFLRRADQK